MPGMFRTQFEPHLRVSAHPGSGDKPVYSPYYTEDGVLELEQTGKENLYEYIQSHAEGVDIHVILARFAATGDTDIINRVQGFSFDATDMPKTYAEALNAMIHAENYFNSLPVETRARFNHNFSEFLASLDQPGFLTKLGVVSAAADIAGTPSPTVTPVAPSPESQAAAPAAPVSGSAPAAGAGSTASV